MLLDRSIPLCVYNVANVPDRIEGDDRKITKAGRVVTYSIAIEHKMTIQELCDMGCDVKQVIMMWGDPPSAKNLLFKGLEQSGLQSLARALRDEYFVRRFHAITWFAIGLTVQNLIDLKPDFDTVRVMKVDVPQLIQHGAAELGPNFQMHVNWTDEQWRQLGFEHGKYQKSVDDNQALSAQQKKHRRQWGPRAFS
jgi:hypothetical protein